MNLVTPFLTEMNVAIVDAAQRVLSALKPGFSEQTYSRALVVELSRRGVRLEQDRLFEITYGGELLDLYAAPLIVEGHTLVFCRTVDEFTSTLVAQARGALAVTRLHEVLVLNFQRVELGWERIVACPVSYSSPVR